jgi:ABC-type uncharacterized transport system ATPase component
MRKSDGVSAARQANKTLLLHSMVDALPVGMRQDMIQRARIVANANTKEEDFPRRNNSTEPPGTKKPNL